VAAVRQQVRLRPGPLGGLIREPRYVRITHEDQQVNVAPVVGVATAERSNQGGAFDSWVSLQQAKYLLEQAVTQSAKTRWSGCHRCFPGQPALR
jgi:hypothetical protein